MSEEHVPGMGCKCHAWSERECCCDGVDWRSEREVELEAQVEAEAGAKVEAWRENDLLRAKVERLEKALQYVVDWRMPECGSTWDDGSPMSFAVAFGSNGQRDHIRGIARAALEGKQDG